MSEKIDRLWRIRETLTDFADIAALELAISALSHASGQEAGSWRFDPANYHYAGLWPRLRELRGDDNAKGDLMLIVRDIERRAYLTHPRTCPSGEVERDAEQANRYNSLLDYPVESKFQKDAARYRWLRSELRTPGHQSIWVAMGSPGHGLSQWMGEHLDSAIDLASSEVKGDPLAPVAVTYDAMGSRSQGT